MMKCIITYGTFDLLHYGHIKLLKRAKALGDYLIVGVTSDSYDKERGKLNVSQPLLERIKNVELTGLADKIIVEEYEGQKIIDIRKYHVDVFAIGSDWVGKFDYLNEYCQVVYLERTRGISSTELRTAQGTLLNVGMIGCGRIASRFVLESKYVSGINVAGVYNPNCSSAASFANEKELGFYTDQLEELYKHVNAIYIASPHQTHFAYIMSALNAGKHVLCEKPLTLTADETKNAYALALKKQLVLMEAIKTAYCPGFEHLLVLAKSGRIGHIVDVNASFTKLSTGNLRELRSDMSGGSINELGSYPLLPIIKLLGIDPINARFSSYQNGGIDLFTKGFIQYANASASLQVGLGAKTEGSLVITGTKGYLYVPAPWWKTEYFEMRFEDSSKTNKYFYRFEDDGLRYEITEFLSLINNHKSNSDYWNSGESIAAAKLIEDYHLNKNVYAYDF